MQTQNCAAQRLEGPKVRPLPTNNKKFITIIAIVIGFISLAPSRTQAQWPYATDVNPRWSLEMGARIFDRPGDDAAIPIATNSVTNEVLFDSQQATDLNTTAGIDLRVNFTGHHYDNNWEFRTIIADFDANTQLEGPNLEIDLLPGFSPDLVDYNYNSRLWSFELNHKRPSGAGLNWLCGPRFISLKEETTTQVEQLVITDFGPFNAMGTAEIQTNNSLYGLQAGFEYNLPVSQSVYFSVIGKVGGFYNPASQSRVDFNNFDPDVILSGNSRSVGSYLGEVNARLYFEVIPSCVSLFMGYDAMVIGEVAIAPDQYFASDPSGSLNTSGTPFFQSITFGVQMQH